MNSLQTGMRASLGVTAFWILIGLMTSVTEAQPALPAYEVIRIGVEQGLSNRYVYDVLEDRQGFMWFATREGLNRYDGHRFVVYRHQPTDSLSLPDTKVLSLFESIDGTLWIGTNGGLVRFERSTETFHSIPFRPDSTQQLFIEPIMDIAETPDGTIWIISGEQRLFRLPPNMREVEWVPVSVRGSMGSARSSKIGVDPTGQIFLFCTPAGTRVNFLGRLDQTTGECSEEKSLPKTSVLDAIDIESGGSLIFGSSLQTTSRTQKAMLQKWDGHVKWTTVLDAIAPRDLLVDNTGQIWLATHSGVFLLDPDGRLIAHFTNSPLDAETLSNDWTSSVTQTRDGSIWVATDDGLTVFVSSKMPFRALRHHPGDPLSLGDPRVNAILETSDGSLWIGTSNGLYKRALGAKIFEPIYLPDAPYVVSGTQSRIWSMIEAAPGVIWFGTARGGLHELDVASGEVRHVTSAFQLVTDSYEVDKPTLDGLSIPYIGRDRAGNLWLPTQREILRVDSLFAFSLVTIAAKSLPPFQRLVNLLMQDHRGDYWVGNDLGLWAFKPDTGDIQPVGEAGSRDQRLSYRGVWTLAESPLTPHAIWIGTIGGGLNRFDVQTGRFTWYTTTEGMPSNTVYGVLADDRGLLWMSTTNGIVRFNPLSGSIEQFTQHDGLHDNDFDLMAFHKGKVSGKMWFGGPTGLTEFHPDSIAVIVPDFRVNISGISVLDRPYPGIVGESDTLRLSRTQNTLGFRFSAPDLLHPDHVAFRYRLVGYDDDWRMNDATQPEAFYTRLPPGWYTFEVQAAGPGPADHSGPTTHLAVSIVPAFWQTGWFKFICIVVAAGAFGGVFSSIQRRREQEVIELARREVELKRLLAEREDQERGRLAREIHDGPIQTLYSVNHRLEEASPEGVMASRSDVKDLASELRAICEHLRPALVDTLGLEGALRSHIRKLSNAHPELEITLGLDPECSDLDSMNRHACYRIVQEALSNVIQHSSATRVDVRLSVDEAMCHLIIEDNGVGFELPKDWLTLAHGSHYGLVGMRERAEMQGGSVRIDSSMGKGTRIEVEISKPNRFQIPPVGPKVL